MRKFKVEKVEVDGKSALCREGLFVDQTKLKSPKTNKRLPFRGLFTSKAIPAGGFIGLYCGEIVEAKEGVKSKSHYNILMDNFLIKLNKSQVKPQDTPLAFANEPQVGEVANAFGQMYFYGNELSPRLKRKDGVEAFALHACKRIEKGEEITWNYGTSYNKIRESVYDADDSGQYVGRGCSLSKKKLEHPAEYIKNMREKHGPGTWVIRRVTPKWGWFAFR